MDKVHSHFQQNNNLTCKEYINWRRGMYRIQKDSLYNLHQDHWLNLYCIVNRRGFDRNLDSWLDITYRDLYSRWERSQFDMWDKCFRHSKRCSHLSRVSMIECLNWSRNFEDMLFVKSRKSWQSRLGTYWGLNWPQAFLYWWRTFCCLLGVQLIIGKRFIIRFGN